MNTLNSVSERLESVEALNMTVVDAGWRLDFRQLAAGVGAVDLDACTTDAAILLKVNLGRRVHQRAAPPRGYLTFGVPVAPQASFRLGGRQVGSESLTNFNADTGMDCVTESGFCAYTYSFKHKRMVDLVQLLEMSDLPESGTISGGPRYVEPDRLSYLRTISDALFTYMGCAEISEIERRRLLAITESELPLMVLQAWSGSVRESRVPINKRYAALQRAMEYIHSQPVGLFTIEELCRESACSLSTLERAFREHFGVSPKRYISALRLSGVHRALLTPHDPRSIGDIAADWGFWHMSKFAADYKTMFGELPSITRASTGFPGAF